MPDANAAADPVFRAAAVHEYQFGRPDARTVLLEHGIVIEQVRTPQPVFGYLRHSDNTCAVKAAKNTAK